MPSLETVRLYHSTDSERLKQIQADGCLFGRDGLGDETSGANLTPDRQASEDFIVYYRGQGQWTVAQGAPTLLTLAFELPKELTKFTRITPIFNCPEYATTLTVEAQYLPDTYLNYLHAGNGKVKMPLEKAVQLERERKIRFYYVPLKEYLRDISSISFTYKGITYPLPE